MADVDFLVVGEGELRSELEAEVGRLDLGGRVRFLGLRHDVPALLGAVDVLVLTSRYEGLPNVVIEAMATGAVAVATDVGGARELLVSGETGFIVPPGDAQAVADAVLAVLRAPESALRTAAAARRRVETEFTVDAMVRRTTELYERCLARTRPAGRAVAAA